MATGSKKGDKNKTKRAKPKEQVPAKTSWSNRWIALGTLSLVVIGILTVWIMAESERADVQVSTIYFSKAPIVANTMIIIKTEIRNVGPRTATITDGRIFYRFSENGISPLPVTPDYTSGGLYENNINGTTFPGEVRVGDFYPMHRQKRTMFSKEQIRSLNSGNAKFWVYGYFTYGDAFSIVLGDTTVGFCYRYTIRRLEHCGFEGRNYVYVR